jgi:exodeoxyribonuclease V alpha subunit
MVPEVSTVDIIQLSSKYETMTQDLFNNDQSASISGTIERVTFQSPESGFCVLKVKAKGFPKLVAVVGNAPDIQAGEWIEASGIWITDPKFGQQLKAEYIRTITPETLAGKERYLGSGLIKGIGPAMAERLVGAFGNDVLEVIDKEPNRLTEVAGIGPGRCQQIKKAWADQRQVREVMVFLHGHGVTTGRAVRICKEYGRDSISKISDDPYCLARDIHGMGFRLADKIATSLNIVGDAPQRAAAGVEFTLQELTTEGHCLYPESDLVQKAAELLGIGSEAVMKAVQQSVQTGRLVREDGEKGVPHVALKALSIAENELALDLTALLSEPLELDPGKINETISWVEKKTNISLAAGQRQAVALALKHKVLVITGGPGVGKTTLLQSILEIHQAKGRKVVACAPTGRAARRLAETTHLQARTIHRLLEFNPATGGFRHGRHEPLVGDVFVVDEFSMVDITLAWQLIRSIPTHAVLLVVGDVDQLPSVGPGRVLADLIDSDCLPVARLTEVFRQAAASNIVTNAHRINGGQIPEITGDDFFFIKRDNTTELADLVIDLVSNRLPKKLNIDPVRDIQVLTPMKRGDLGTWNLNQRLQEALNAKGQGVKRLGSHWRKGDKVMQMVNNYDKDVFNGDSGVIVDVELVSEEIRVRFIDREVTYDFNELDELIHGFAVTIHKSQGSEYPVVVIPLHTQHYVLLQRNLLYTAVTRGKQMVILVGSNRAVSMAVGRVESRQRVTRLAARLQQNKGKL